MAFAFLSEAPGLRSKPLMGEIHRQGVDL